MLKGATGFNAQTNTNKVLRNPYVACRSEGGRSEAGRSEAGRSEAGRRWVIAAWEGCFRPWANAPCPCLHSDPLFPDCPAGETVRLRGGLWFYEGGDIEAELRRIEGTGWRKGE
jgi:hypothetical protein